MDASAVEIHQTFVSEVGLGTEATPFVCDDVVKTENLDWIFLLDVSLLLRLARGRIVSFEYVG